MDIDYLFMSFAIRDFLQQNNEKQSKLDRILEKKKKWRRKCVHEHNELPFFIIDSLVICTYYRVQFKS